MYSRRCDLIENSCARAHCSLSPHSLLTPLLPLFFPHLVFMMSHKRQLLTGSLTTTSASLCYHLPRVYQLDTRTGYEPRERGAHITGSSGRRFWRLTAGYCCEGSLLHHHRRDCLDTEGYVPKKSEKSTDKTWLNKTDHLLLLRYPYGSRTSACTAHIHETASASMH